MGKFKTGCLGVIGIAVVIGLIGSCAGGGTKDQSKATTTTSSSSSSSGAAQAKQKVYADADINVLIKEAKENAASANQNYKKKDVKIIGGKILNIDSDLKDSILKLKKGENVTVYGTITDVGDLMGYSLKLDKIEAMQ